VDHQQLAKYCHNFHQDFVASTHTDFFQGQTDRGLFYWPNHSGETGCPNEKSRLYMFYIKLSLCLNHGMLTEKEG